MKKLLNVLFATLLVVASSPVHSEALPTDSNRANVFVRGAALHGANGLAFDSNNNLRIASLRGREVITMDPATGKILERIGADRGVEGPDDTTFGPDGSLYWTSIFTGEVGRIAPDGTKSTAALLPAGVNPITFSPAGRLFVGLAFFGDALYEVDPTGAIPPRLVAQSLGGPNAFSFGPDGFLYSPLMFKGQVVRIDPDMGAIAVVASGFSFPVAAKFDSQGRLFVADLANGQVVRVDTATGARQIIATLPPGLDNLAFDTHDRLFVSNAADGSIVEILAGGGVRWVSRPGSIAPGGLAVLAKADGASVFVADSSALREFDLRTGRPLSVQKSLPTVGTFASPYTASADGSRLILTSWSSKTVQVWDPATRQVLESYSDFATPLNAIRFQGDLVVAELGTGQVVRASALDPSQRTPLAVGLGTPAGLAATADALWVSDRSAGTVLQIVAGGQALSTPIQVASGLSFPEGLAVAPDGGLLVVESGTGRLSHIDSATGKVTTVADNLEIGLEAISGTPSTFILNGVAVGPSGVIYVSGDKANVLYRFARSSD